MPWCQTPSQKKESRRVYNYDDRRLSVSSKRMEFQKYVKYLKLTA